MDELIEWCFGAIIATTILTFTFKILIMLVMG
jgi:hypothetical protein